MDGDGAETAAMERDEDDANWPVLSALELQVCLTDWGSAALLRPSRPFGRVSVLSGGRKPRRRRSWSHRLWLLAAGLAGFVGAAMLVIKL